MGGKETGSLGTGDSPIALSPLPRKFLKIPAKWLVLLKPSFFDNNVHYWDFCSGLTKLPTNAHMGSIPGLGKFCMLWDNYTPVPQPLGHMLQLLELTHPRAQAL